MIAQPKRIEPTVVFPVAWHETHREDREEITAAAARSVKWHCRYMAAVAEIARRNGGGGFLNVRIPMDAVHIVEEGGRFCVSMAHAEWCRDYLVLTPAVPPEEVAVFRDGPTATEYSLVIECTVNGKHAVRLLRVESRRPHAVHLHALEQTGLTETTAVLCAMDGGQP